MTRPTANGEVRVVTDRERIRQVADRHDAVPVVDDRGDGDVALSRGSVDDDGLVERLAWPAFFERLDRGDLVVAYRPNETVEEPGATFEVVARGRLVPAGGDDDASGGRRGDRPADGEDTVERDDDPTDDPPGVESEQLATGDTGDAEPVVYERTGRGGSADDPEDTSTASTGDLERGPTRAADGLVLDEIHGPSSAAPGHQLAEEYVAFENDGDRRLDLSGWTVENDDGRSFEFPDGTVLDPGERVTVHSAPGDGGEGHLHWDADEPVWDRRDTVTVATATDEPVLREPYEA